MLYRDLVHFEPVESVKQLRAGVSAEQAREDVRTFVISEKMREQLVGVVLPNLRFDNPDWDHKGVLLVATYGTGKTHFMSCLAAVAENADLAAEMTDAATGEAAAAIAGKFKVIRVEIGAVQMSLRDILATELTAGLAALGVEYTFPPLDKVTNNKQPLQQMMAAFEEKYPEHGLFLVIDELLDYLRTRRDMEIAFDLGFLREMAEFIPGERFRLIAGVQETLFDNPRFAAAQDAVRRVRERFQSFRIAREDVAYVVQQRILRKDNEQRAQIRDHLTKFAPAFESIGRDLDAFVDMFPIHPAYLRTFEALTIVEKRRVLSSLSEQIRQRLDQEVPTDEPGVICFDSYRAELEGDPANRVIPEVRDVLQRTRVLRDHVRRNMEAQADVAPALRIVDALAVHRLTTDDIEAPLGLTYDNLRDDLCLLPPGTPELDAAFIANSIETIVDEISKAVSGQFISVNEVNGQVYIDIKKDVDYEEQVNQRAATLDLHALDGAYYKALETLLEVSANPYVAGYRIYSYELPWAAKKVRRLGYLFLGAPNERSTAQPPRDFYIYFLQPYDPPKFDDAMRSDEVFLRLDAPAEAFTISLRRYAASLEKVRESTTQHRAAFEARAAKHLTEMVTWLRANLINSMHVTYQGERKTIAQWLAGVQGSRRSLKEQLDTIASNALTPHFATRYPGYPTFGDEITPSNLMNATQAALGQLSGKDTALGRSVLNALGLRDIDEQVTDTGPFATELLRLLAAARGQAVNGDELLVERDPGVRTWGSWHLEPLWLVVVAAALTYLGRAEVGFTNGQRVTAANLDVPTRMNQNDLERVAFVTTPAGADAAVLSRVATLLGLPPALGQGEITGETAASFVTKAEGAHGSASDLKTYVQSSPRLWGEELFDDPLGRLGRVESYLALLGDVRNRNSAGKLKRLTSDTAALDAATAGKQEIARIEELRRVSEQLSPLVRYLEDAGNVLGSADPYAETAETVRGHLREVLRAAKLDKQAAANVRRSAEELKQQYRAFAVDRHTAERLPGAGEAQKQELVTSGTWRDLQVLTAVTFLPSGQFGDLDAKLVGLTACKQFSPEVFDAAYTCPHCNYRPRPSTAETAHARLKQVTDRAAELWEEWMAALRSSLGTPEIAEQASLLDPAARVEVQRLLDDRIAPGEVTSELVAAAEQLMQRFALVQVSSANLRTALFPASRAITVAEAAHAFEKWLNEVASGAGGDPARVRLVAADEEMA
ncbi:DUF6079 family protein [Cellulomonas chengniuliangii]|uniref:DUF6079 family protein n=1 Tax=Cellulomonas chengniuliangii TaxID=2968084 RepID=A0ABY5KZW6_9CELL|nr:DUF6079 family protein [Cellulomonas chengniuliangii]MCC2309163.1 DUF6079 family protein [Cellulomonas chengniuliangii]UUI75255.1 DUF6079 family protein [Cellulomonas chengniuliangii]